MTMPTATLDPRLQADATELHAALQELLRAYQFRDRDRICCYDLSVTQCGALEVLHRRGPLSGNELAAALYLDKSTTSRVVDALERKGYAARTADPDDRRARRISATKEGRALYRRIERDLIDHEQRLIAEFDPETRRAMTALVRKLAQAASDGIQVGGGSCCLKP